MTGSREPLQGFRHLCPICGKEFWGGSGWKFRRKKRVYGTNYTTIYFCSWKCFRAEEIQEEEEAKEQEEMKKMGEQPDYVEEQIVKHEWKGNTDNISYGKLIVRCKDCKHGYILTDSAYVVCGRRFHDGQRHEADWFCADGVRADDRGVGIWQI